MNNRISLLDFHLFEGEGGGMAGAQPGTASSEQTSQPQKVEYGKSRGDGGANSQVGTDNGEDISAEWQSLVGKGGRFHDLYGQSVSSAIQERFKNQRDLQGLHLLILLL